MKRTLAWTAIFFMAASLVAFFFIGVTYKPKPLSLIETRLSYIVLGDSIGVGIGQAMAREFHFRSSKDTVRVCAVSGQRHEKIPQQLSVCAKGHYDVVIVSTGTNEASHRDGSVNLGAIAQFAATHPSTRGAILVVAGPPCTKKWFNTYAASIDKQLASQGVVRTVSLRSFCADSADGVHHSAAQYLKMFQEIERSLR